MTDNVFEIIIKILQMILIKCITITMKIIFQKEI